MHTQAGIHVGRRKDMERSMHILKPIRNACLFALVMIGPLSPLVAQSLASHVVIEAPAPTYTTSISTRAGVLLGTAKEFVYSNGYKVSELDWSLSPVVYYGTRLTMTATSGFTVALDVTSGFGGLSGSITDSDFLNGDGVKTHFSKHDCYTERAVSFDLRAGWPALTTPHMVVSLLGVINALDYKWSARDGYLQYPSETVAPYTPWSESTPKTGVVGTGIIYEQGYLALGLMLDAQLKASDALSAVLGLGFSPIATCNDVDNHLFTGVDYYETMSGGYLFHVEGSMEFRIKPMSRLTIGASYILVQGLVGDTKMVYTSAQSTETPGTTYTSSNSGGASLSVFDLNLRMTFEL